MIYVISVSFAVFLYCSVVLIFLRSTREKDAVRNRIEHIEKEGTIPLSSADEDLDKPLFERLIKPLVQKLTQSLSAIIPLKSLGNGGSEKQKIMLQQAGWTISPEEYSALQLTLMICCGALGLVISFILKLDLQHKLLYVFTAAFGAYTILRFVCASTGSKRKASMEKQLPDMLDLLSVSVSAGLGFERAMLHIIETMDGPLIDEFAVSYREMSMGRSRKDALTLLGERCGVEDLSAVTGAIVQAGQLGLPISNVLQSQSAAIRRARRSRVQEKAAKVSTKILIPMVGFIFPVLIIVLMGPSLITILGQFG